jgi:hypothetical protein
MRFVDQKVTAVVLTNQRAANPGNIAVGVAKLYLPPVEGAANSTKSP